METIAPSNSGLGCHKDVTLADCHCHFVVSSHDEKVIAKAERRSDSVAHKLRSENLTPVQPKPPLTSFITAQPCKVR
jgi:hypothetical protein